MEPLVLVLYAVLNRDGKIRKNRHRSPMIYEKQGTAQRQCGEGDSVVECYIDRGKAPLFIREKKYADKELDE